VANYNDFKKLAESNPKLTTRKAAKELNIGEGLAMAWEARLATEKMYNKKRKKR
jgi:hypothetical protein